MPRCCWLAPSWILFLGSVLLLLGVIEARDDELNCSAGQYNPESHYESLARKLSENSGQQQQFTLSVASDSSQVRSQAYKQNTQQLDIRNLTQILQINPTSVRVQARCKFGDLVAETLRHNLIPAVVPEFKSITVGGAVVGAALESTSFRFAQVSDNVLSATVLLGNSTIQTISLEGEGTELFHALPGSYGTLGVVLEVDLKVIPAKEYVKINLLWFLHRNEGIERLQQLSLDNSLPFQFLDALDFPDGRFVICAGEFVDLPTKAEEIHRIEEHDSLWFYELVQQEGRESLVLPTYDYLFRYERGAFWMARPLEFSMGEVFRDPPLLGKFFASWKYTRSLFGRFFTATNLFRLLHKADSEAIAEKFVIMDAYMPASNASSLAGFVRNRIPISVPLWYCPVKRVYADQPLSPSGTIQDSLIINVGIWGRVGDNRGHEYTRMLINAVRNFGGRKMLYSQTHQTEEEFYHYQVDGEAYQKLRENYAASSFPSLYEKLAKYEVTSHKNNLHYWLSRILL